MTKGKSKPKKPKSEAPKKSKLARAAPKFAKAFVLTALAGLLVLAAFRYHWLDAWQWSATRGPSIYVAAAGLVGLGALVIASRRGGKPAFWGAAVAVVAGLGAALFVPAVAGLLV